MKVVTPPLRSSPTRWAASSNAVHSPHPVGADGPTLKRDSANAARSALTSSAIVTSISVTAASAGKELSGDSILGKPRVRRRWQKFRDGFS